jgi:PAS domain S-box-containing protein
VYRLVKEVQNTGPDLKQIAFLISKISEGVAYCKILTDEHKRPVDWLYLEVNEAYEQISGVKKAEVVGKTALDIFPKVNRNPEGLISIYGAVALTGKSIVTEHYSKSCDKWYHISAYSPQTGYFVTVFEDITARKKVEEELRQTKEALEKKIQSRTKEVMKERRRLYNVLETLPSYIILLDQDHKVPFANRVFRELFGESHGKRCFEFLFNRSTPCENCETYKVLQTNRPHRWEWLGPNGRYYAVSDFPFTDQDGSIQILEMGLDVTDRKRDEAELKKYREHLEQLVAERTEALRESEERWATTLNSIGDGVIATDIEGNVTFINPVAEDLTGWNEKEAAGKPIKQIFNIINEQTRKEAESPVSKVLTQGLIIGLANHTLLIRKDGTEVPIDDSGAPIITQDGAIRGVVLVFRDVTERRKTEEAIQRQAALIDLSPDAIIVRKIDGTITFWSRGAEKLYGWTKTEAVGKSTHELLATKFPQPFDAIVSELKEKQSWTGEVTQKTKTGREVVMQSWWRAEKTEHGEIKSILESNVDVTERERAEKEIARLASFPTLSPNPVLEVDFDGRIIYANPATEKLFPDLKTAGLSHTFFLDWFGIKEFFEGKSTNTFGREVNINGRWYHQQFCLVPQTHQIRIYITDIDELKQTEQARARAQQKLEENAVMLEEYASQMEEIAEQRAQQLQNAERLAAIGQTAGMVGHDIRNPLQAITSDMYLISEEVNTMKDGESKQAIMESIASVNQNLAYINKIVSDLQDYTRPLKPNIQDANLTELIEGALLTISVPEDIEVTTDIKQTPIPIKTDISYMRRILTNLVTNAVQAMQENGKLTVKAAAENGVVTISVQDTGMGISEEVRGKMFTPLFTTKSKGQGLGLAVVKRLVDALNGTVKFESEEGKGTKFIVELPQTI